VLRLVEEMEVSGRKGIRKTKENLERYSEEGFGTNRSGRECGIGSRKMERDHWKSDPCLEGKYRLETIMMMMISNHCSLDTGPIPLQISSPV